MNVEKLTTILIVDAIEPLLPTWKKLGYEVTVRVPDAGTCAFVILSGKAGEEGKLFGSITSQDVADALARAGHTVDKRRIELDHPIKTLGDHAVKIRLHPEVHAELRVSVVAE